MTTANTYKLNELIRAIDYLDMVFLFTLALEDTEGVIRKISIRQLGRKRIDKLHSHIAGMDQKKLLEHKSLLLCISSICAKELTHKMWKAEKETNEKQAAETASNPEKANKQPDQSISLGETPSQEEIRFAEPLNASQFLSEPQGESHQDHSLQPKKNHESKNSKPSGVDHSEARKQITDYFNLKANRKMDYDNKAANQAIDNMLEQAKLVEEFLRIIDNQSYWWIEVDPNSYRYLFPQTLFRPSHWDTYLINNPPERQLRKGSNPPPLRPINMRNFIFR